MFIFIEHLSYHYVVFPTCIYMASLPISSDIGRLDEQAMGVCTIYSH